MDSWPSHNEVGAFFFEFEAVRTEPRCSTQVEDDSVQQFFGAWLRWLHSTSDQDWAAWSKRAKKYSVSLGDAVAGLLIFDAMCFEALRRMYPTSTSCGDIMREHLSFHDRLHFTTEVRDSV